MSDKDRTMRINGREGWPGNWNRRASLIVPNCFFQRSLYHEIKTPLADFQLVPRMKFFYRVNSIGKLIITSRCTFPAS
jgi:hypothetical protein